MTSVFQPTPTRLGRVNNYVRQRIVRNGLSRALTQVYSRFGLAHRQVLVDQLQNHTPEGNNHELLLDRMVAQGILKDRFRAGLFSLEDLEAFMISGRTSQTKLEGLELTGLDLSEIFANSNVVLSLPVRMAQGVYSGCYSIAQYATNREGLATAFSFGVRTAKVLGVILGAAGAAWFVGGVPTLNLWNSAALGLAGTTALCVIATKINDKFPLHGFYGAIGSTARFLSRKAAPIAYALDGLFVGGLVYESNLRIQSIFEAIGLEGTTAFLFSLGFAFNHYLRSRVQGFSKAYGGMLDPGMRKYMRRLMTGAALSAAAEVHYIGTRVMLFCGASAYLMANVWEAMGPLGLLPLSLPLLGFYATYRLRGRQDVTYNSKQQADRWDYLKVWSPLLGLATGAAAAVILGIKEGSWIAPIVYSTLYGSFATLFLNELHGSFHSINTSLGFIESLQTSAKDLVGEQEKRDLSDDKRLLIINPHTGTKEHSYGLLFSVILNRKPNASFVCMYDLILAQRDVEKGTLPRQADHRVEKTFIGEVNKIQQRIYQQLLDQVQRITTTDPQQRNAQVAGNYQQFATNLRQLADYLEGQLEAQIRVMSSSGWFAPLHEVAEARRAIFEQVAFRAEEFRQLAQKLERQVAKGYISEADFYQQWSHLLRCYDPIYVKKIAVARKSLGGDEKKVRKVENVATGLILRGMTVYKGWAREEYQTASGEAVKDHVPYEDWISGTWTQFPNPEFRYNAAPGTFESSKFIWLRREQVIAELQEQNSDCLSSSQAIASVDNEPSGREGFQPGARNIAIVVNGERRELDPAEYFFMGPGRGGEIDHDQVPTVKRINFRDNAVTLPDDYRLAYDNTRVIVMHGRQPGRIRTAGSIDERPQVFSPPAFDYSLMMDKSDVQVNPDLLPTILERAKLDKFIHLMLRQPVNVEYEFDNPYPDKPDKIIDLSRGGIQVYDTTVELAHRDAKGKEWVIPYKVDRGAAHVGIDDTIGGNWDGLTSARIVMANGQPTYFALIYRGVAKGDFSDFAHGVITRNQLQVFGNKADQIWQALQDRGYLDQTNNSVGAIQAKFYARPENFTLGLDLTSSERRQLLRLLASAPKTEHIWHALHEAGYVDETENDYGIVQSSFDPDNFTLNNGLQPEIVAAVRAILSSHIREMSMPPRYIPQFWRALELPAGGDITLAANNFMRKPHREGDVAWVMIPYTDGTVAFARTPDGGRPMLFNKDWRVIDQGGQP